jgi:penicillin-binding protein 1C
LVVFGIRGAANLVPIHAEDLAQIDQAVEFRDRNHRPLGTLLSRNQEHTAVVPLDQVSPHFLNAILAAEDQRFYHHGAVDLQAVVRASWQSLKAGHIVSGASTITMQLARTVEPSPRTWGGKVQQVWHSWRIAAGMSKDEILAAYVNRLPMGGNIYGVEAASRTYFGVSAADLTPAQASLLAALPNAPTVLNPYFNWDNLKQRQRYVLNRMVEDGYLSRKECHRILAQPVTVLPPDQSLLAAPHFLFWLAEQLPTNHPAQVQTTLDLNLQRFVEAQVQQAVEGLAQHQVHQAAALVVDNTSGNVLAYVGSPSYFATQQSGRNDGVQALRQPGSTLKPFLYQLALEREIIKPNTILQDEPIHYPIPGGQLYSPMDYSNTFQGPVRVRAALANSLNIPAVQILEDVTVPAFLERLHQLGFSHLDHSPDHYGLGLALGSGEVTLWELAQAYLILAHNGDFTATLILS